MKQQLARVWDLHTGNVLGECEKNVQILTRAALTCLRVRARFTFVNVFQHVSLAHEPTLVADVDLESVGLIKQAFLQKIGRAVRNDAIALHFAKP